VFTELEWFKHSLEQKFPHVYTSLEESGKTLFFKWIVVDRRHKGQAFPVLNTIIRYVEHRKIALMVPLRTALDICDPDDAKRITEILEIRYGFEDFTGVGAAGMIRYPSTSIKGRSHDRNRDTDK